MSDTTKAPGGVKAASRAANDTEEPMAAWLEWACPETPSSMRDEPLLAALRARWPLDGGGDGPRDMELLYGPIEEQRARRWAES